MVREIMDKSKWEKIKNFNYKKYKFFLLPVVLLLLMPISFLLIREQQDIRQRASEITPTPTPSFGSTPISEVSKYPRPQSAIKNMTFLIFHNHTLTQEVKDYFGKELDYIWLDQSSLSQNVSGVINFNSLYTFVDTFSALYPHIKIGTHAGAAGAFGSFHIPYNSLTDRDYLHSPAGTVLKFSPDTRLTYFNIGDNQTRATIAATWKQIFDAHPGLTGLTIDSYYSYHSQAALANGCKEGPCNTQDYWVNNMGSLSELINSTLPSEKDVLYNGIFSEQTSAYQRGDMNNGYVRHHDGVLSEWPHEMLLGTIMFRKYIETFMQDIENGKKVFFWVQPQIIKVVNDTRLIDIPNDLSLQRYFLTTYLLFQSNPLTYFGYHPGEIYNGIKVFFYKDWNLDFGNPIGKYREENGLFVRTYDNGIAVVNPSTSTINYTLPAGDYRKWDPEFADIVNGAQVIPGRSGVFFFKPLCTVMPAPQNIKPSGVVGPGTQTLSWDKVPGAVRYLLRIDDKTNTSEPTGACQGRAGDVCMPLTENTYNYNFVEGHNYSWWVHAVNYCGVYGKQTNTTITVSSNISPTPTNQVTPTPTPTITVNTPTPTRIPTPTPTSTPTPTPFVDKTAPTVIITNPVSGTSLRRGTTVTFAASASDNIGVARVQFFNNGTLLNTDITSPFSFSWSIPTASGVQLKTTTLSVTAYDAAGNKTSFSRSYSIR